VAIQPYTGLLRHARNDEEGRNSLQPFTSSATPAYLRENTNRREGAVRYGVWFLRFVFAAWMIPAGLNHFIPLFPQPMGNQPLSTELITALIDSHLFDIVKAVELIAGLCVLFGFYVPLALILCMPVSFCVFWWDAPLQGWGTTSAIYGWAALISNLLLCLAYFESYRPMFALRSEPRRWSRKGNPLHEWSAAPAPGPEAGV